MSRGKMWLRSVMALALVLGGGERAWSQERTGPTWALPREDTTATLRDDQRPSNERTAAAPVVPLLDAPIDRQEYVLGPGDVLTVSLFGDAPMVHTLPVSPEGMVTIPAAGVVPVLGLNLDQAEARIRSHVLGYYRNVGVHATLAQVRQFKVFVVGDVEQPGVYVASSVTRVSEVLSPAVSDSVARRSIRLVRGGDTLAVDLARFRQSGSLKENPVLQEGDVIVVPAVDETVGVFGAVTFPGKYEYRPGESLAELLRVANGGQEFPSSAAAEVLVSRLGESNQRELFRFTRGDAMGAGGAAFHLAPFDAVFIAERANYAEQYTATATGQVRFPGTYPIVPGETTVRDLVTIAGGLTEEASIATATLTRKPLLAGQVDDLQNVPDEFLSREERQIRLIRAQGSATNVVIDFPRLFASGAEGLDQPLQDGDELHVPRLRREIAIIGAVRQPGLVAYTPGWTVSQFVELAGGYSHRASRGDVTILKGRLGTRTNVRDAVRIEPGDLIVVPYKEPRTFTEVLGIVNSVFGTISGMILTIYTLGQIF